MWLNYQICFCGLKQKPITRLKSQSHKNSHHNSLINRHSDIPTPVVLSSRNFLSLFFTSCVSSPLGECTATKKTRKRIQFLLGKQCVKTSGRKISFFLQLSPLHTVSHRSILPASLSLAPSSIHIHHFSHSLCSLTLGTPKTRL